MIVFLVTPEHTYTHEKLVGTAEGVSVRVLSYARLAEMTHVPRATYIFTDADRLSTQMLKFAAQRYRELHHLGLNVLNDPARALSRSGLLRALYARDLNRFNVHRVEDGVAPMRWPVFLRTEGDHAGPLPELFHSQKELEKGIRKAVREGTPISRLLIVEYMAEPLRPGLFRKFSVFRVGKSSFAHTCVHESQWIAKDGELGVATAADYDDEYRIVRDNPYAEDIAPAFELAGLAYGRADFGIVDGKPQIYEINSNPTMGLELSHPFPVRLESYRLFHSNYFAALRAIDTPDPPKEVLAATRWNG